MTNFVECDWSQFYHDGKETIPPNAPEPLGKEADILLYVDLDDAGDFCCDDVLGSLFFWYLLPKPRLFGIQKTVNHQNLVEFVAKKITNGSHTEFTVQTSNDWSTFRQTNKIHLWGQYVCGEELADTGIPTKEEKQFHLLPCREGIGSDE